MISVQGKFLCNNITEGFTFFRYNRDTKFERGTKHWQKEWQVSIKKDVLGGGGGGGEEEGGGGWGGKK